MPASRLFLGYREDARATSMTPVFIHRERGNTGRARRRLRASVAKHILQRLFPIRAPFVVANRRGIRLKRDGHDRTTVRRRSGAGRIAARVASFKATQEKFEREREEYFVTTLENARSGSERLPSWS